MTRAIFSKSESVKEAGAGIAKQPRRARWEAALLPCLESVCVVAAAEEDQSDSCAAV